MADRVVVWAVVDGRDVLWLATKDKAVAEEQVVTMKKIASGRFRIVRCVESSGASPDRESATWPYVLAFAHEMERKLAANCDKGDRDGWINDTAEALLERLRDETKELSRELKRVRPDLDATRSEAADVANFAMMIADVAGGLSLLGATPREDARAANIARAEAIGRYMGKRPCNHGDIAVQDAIAELIDLIHASATEPAKEPEGAAEQSAGCEQETGAKDSQAHRPSGTLAGGDIGEPRPSLAPAPPFNESVARAVWPGMEAIIPDGHGSEVAMDERTREVLRPVMAEAARRVEETDYPTESERAEAANLARLINTPEPAREAPELPPGWKWGVRTGDGAHTVVGPHGNGFPHGLREGASRTAWAEYGRAVWARAASESR